MKGFKKINTNFREKKRDDNGLSARYQHDCQHWSTDSLIEH